MQNSPYHFWDFKFPWLESRPWYGYIAAAVGMAAQKINFALAGITHADLDSWMDTFAKAGGLFLLGITACIQIFSLRKRMREDPAFMARMERYHARARSATRFLRRKN